MHGDRLANELWYDYEQTFYYNATPEIRAAYAAVGEHAGGDVEGMFYVYSLTRKAGTYPEKFYSRVEPARDAYAYLSRLQLEILDRYCRNERDLAHVFLRLGDGSLYDPRMPEGFKVHMMNLGPNGEPPMNWLVWHAIIRAMTMLDIDARRWNSIDRWVGLGWAAQSILKPRPEQVNPPMARKAARRLTLEWARRTPEEMDKAFDSFPYPEGVS
jgi:hypothetical protein